MLRYIRLVDRILEYELTWKDVKNINLRVRGDGRVTVSAHKRVGISAVERFLRSNEAFILRALDRAEAAREAMPEAECSLLERGYLPILGIERQIQIEKGTANRASLVGDTVLITVKEEKEEHILSAIRDMLGQYAERLIPDLCHRMAMLFPEGIPSEPIIRFRRMVSRWGSCCPSTETVTFNKLLICAPMECIEYVVVHELAHFFMLDHSPRFYQVVSRVMPDWKQRKKRLEPYGPWLRIL